MLPPSKALSKLAFVLWASVLFIDLPIAVARNLGADFVKCDKGARKTCLGHYSDNLQILYKSPSINTAQMLESSFNSLNQTLLSCLNAIPTQCTTYAADRKNRRSMYLGDLKNRGSGPSQNQTGQSGTGGMAGTILPPIVTSPAVAPGQGQNALVDTKTRQRRQSFFGSLPPAAPTN